MNDTLRYLFAGILIFLIIILQPLYLEWLGYSPEDHIRSDEQIEPVLEKSIRAEIAQKNIDVSSVNTNKSFGALPEQSLITISSPLYTATLTNRSGGSFVSYIIKDGEINEKRKYKGGHDDNGRFNPNSPVSLIMSSEKSCMPCLASYDERADQYFYFNQTFSLIGSHGVDTLSLNMMISLNCYTDFPVKKVV